MMDNKNKINPNAGKVVNNIGLKIFVGALAIISVILVGYYVVDVYFVQHEPNYFEKHFLAAIAMMLIGIIAFLLPTVYEKKYANNKGDSLMVIVAFLLFICAIISIVYSYVA